MKFMVNGRTYPDGNPIAPPIEEEELTAHLLGALAPRIDALREEARATGGLTTYRGELEREPTVDLGDPKSAGWTVLFAQDDPQADDRIAAVADLAKHRGVEQLAPLVFDGSDVLDWPNWLDANYANLPRPPHYVAILGGPDKVPFHFQALLDTGAAVGRLDFDSLDDLAAYAEKIVRLEDRANAPVTVDSAAFFAPDGGPSDPTHFSRRFMVEPLIEQTRDEAGFTPEVLLGDDATKSALAAALATTKSALVYTASHGMVDFEGPLEKRKAMNGAICCQAAGSGESLDELLFTADDVPPHSEPFLEGAVFFQFACYGAGTPATSDFAHWNLPNIPPVNASEDFSASLPKRLLSHPRGPVAFVGHVDIALLHGFDDPDMPEISERWHPRLAPFRRAVERLLGSQPVGYAMADLNDRYSKTSATLTNTFDRVQNQTLTLTPEVHARLADAFLVRNDAQNYASI